jgi:hypothetical protein
LNTPKSEAAVVAPCSSVPGILTGILSSVLSILRASATHVAGGARVGGTVAGTQGEDCPKGQAVPPRVALPGETRDCWGAAHRKPSCGGPVQGSTAMLAKRLSRNGVGTCASGHSAGPLGVSMHFVHGWSGSYAVEAGVGVAGCGIMGGVGRVEGASVNGWSLGALNAAARWAFRVGAWGGFRLRRARAAFLSWVAMSWRRPMLTSCLTDSTNLEALQS